MRVTVAVCLATIVVLSAVAVEDWRRFRIRNMFVVALVALFSIDAAFGDRIATVLPHIVLGGVCFGFLLFAFARDWIGGGDAKLLAAALLWMRPHDLVPFSVALMASTLGYTLGARFGWFPARDVGARRAIPFGPSIAAAWIVVLVNTTLNIGIG